VPATPRGVRFKRDGARGRGWKRSPDAHYGDYDRTPAGRSTGVAAPIGRDSKVGDEAISLSQNIDGDFSADARGGIEVSASDLGQIIEQHHRTVYAFVQGDPEPYKQLSSRRDDVTLANPLGPLPVVGTRSRRPWTAPLPRSAVASPFAPSRSRRLSWRIWRTRLRPSAPESRPRLRQERANFASRNDHISTRGW
jgi:hypothetical protein